MPRKIRKKQKRANRKSRRAKRPDSLQEALKAYVRSEGVRFLDDKNITSVGVGYKVTKGQDTGQLCVQFTVRAKKGQGSELEALGTTAIPKTVRIGKRDVPTDVIQREYHARYTLVHEAETTKDVRKKRLETLVPGISVGHPETTAGTLGAIVYDSRTGHPCVLSNWHVLNTPKGKPGDAMLQPGPYDDNRVGENRAGTLLRSHLGIAGDCAVASIEGRGFDASIMQLQTPVRRLARPELGDSVVKSGRTTGVTYGKIRRVDTVIKLDYGDGTGEQLIGGFEIGPDPSHPAAKNEISMGGDSGSVWLIADPKGKPTDIMVGLHFAGEGQADPDEHAVACYAHSVFEKLEISLQPQRPAAAGVEEDVVGTGFAENFLSVQTPFPRLTAAVKPDAVKLGGSHLIHYTHFTICQSASRRMPRLVAWNIDGNNIRKLSRKGLNFVFDPRFDSALQTGNDAYADNKLDRGHIARRADLTWGPLAEARRANKDSFYYTNIAPQHQAFNQSERHGLWGLLENAILDEVDVENLRVSVMGGPIFKDADMEYRGVRIPSSFWKLIAFVDSADNQLKVKAYILSQDDLLNDIEALDLDPFRLWQVSVTELEKRTHLRFPRLKPADTLTPEAAPEAAAGARGRAREITRLGEVTQDR